MPYANGPVHIGHLAGVYVPADIYVRYLRLKKEDVLTHYMYIDLYAYYHDGKFVPATMVHHIVPISTDYAKRLDRGNLIALSDKSHGIVHKAMREGREEEIIRLLLGYKEKWKKKENSKVGGVVKLF